MTTSPQPRTFAFVVAAAGALIVAGVTMPWITAQAGIFSLQRSGFDAGADGQLMAVIGGGIVLAGLLAALVSLRVWSIVAFLGGVAGLYVGFADYRDVSGRGTAKVDVSVGFGLYLCIVGAVLAALFAVLGLKADAEAHGRPASWLPPQPTQPSP